MSSFEVEEQAHKARAEARIGTVLRGKWRIERLLGVGGMAAVYEGTHRNGKRGAIKLLHPELAADVDARTRFLREGLVANRIEHPGVVSVLDDDTTEDGAVFLVMELLDGKSAADVADERPGSTLEVGEAMRLGEALLDVLVAAHSRGVLHRDIKPENIFLTRNGTLKVLDFGIASVRESAHATRLTKTGAAMGTPAFMPPEQALGEWNRVDARTDLWAVGATLFTLMTGRLVHEAPGLNQLLLKAMTARAPSLREVFPSAQPLVAMVVDKALAFDPAARWQDAASMLAAVRAALDELSQRGVGTAMPVPFGNPARIANDLGAAKRVQQRPAPLGLLVAVVVLACGIGAAVVVFATTPDEAEAPSTNEMRGPATATSAVPLVEPVGVASASVAPPVAPVVTNAAPSAAASSGARVAPRPTASTKARVNTFGQFE